MTTWHTTGRKQPTMVGRDHTGHKIPGGPYTIYQLGAVVVAGIACFATKGLWGAQVGVLSQLLTVLFMAGLAGWAVGRIDFSSGNPFWAAAGLLSSWLGARTRPGGRTGHDSVTAHRSRTWAGGPGVVLTPPAAPASPSAEPAEPDEPAGPGRTGQAPAPAAPGPRLSGLEAFLAAADTNHANRNEEEAA